MEGPGKRVCEEGLWSVFRDARASKKRKALYVLFPLGAGQLRKKINIMIFYRYQSTCFFPQISSFGHLLADYLCIKQASSFTYPFNRLSVPLEVCHTCSVFSIYSSLTF